jgi:dienelactone hydrolase
MSKERYDLRGGIEALMSMTTTDIDYTVDGSVMIGRLVLPEGDDRRPAVLIAHEGGGLDEYQKSRAERFAELGYVAFALDYHGHGKPLASQADMAARCRALWLEPERIRALAGAGLDVLLAEPQADASRVAAVGYCFGGALVLELTRGGADVKAVVGFHPRLATRRPDDAANIRGKVLVCVGTEDPLVSVEERLAFEDEMRAGGVDWRMNLYGGAKHSFTRPGAELEGRPGVEYHQASDQRSWRAMLDLFDEVFR